MLPDGSNVIAIVEKLAVAHERTAGLVPLQATTGLGA